MFNVLERVGIMTDTQATTAALVTFGFKDSGVRCVVCGTFDFQMNYVLVNDVAKCSRFAMIIV